MCMERAPCAYANTASYLLSYRIEPVTWGVTDPHIVSYNAYSICSLVAVNTVLWAHIISLILMEYASAGNLFRHLLKMHVFNLLLSYVFRTAP